jgi:hypothetical protein
MDDKLLQPNVSPLARARHSEKIQKLDADAARGAREFFLAYEHVRIYDPHRWHWLDLRAAWRYYNATTLTDTTPAQYAAAELARKELKRLL